MIAIQSTGLDLGRLEKVRWRGERIECRCPACGELGHDKTGNHLLIQPDGKFSCVVNQRNHEHNKRIWALAGGEIAPSGSYLPPVPSPKPPEILPKHEWSDLERGTPRDLICLSRLREIGLGGLEMAGERGILHFFDNSINGRCWSLTDSRRHVRQDRRLDGLPFRLTDDRLAKSRTLGKPAWPVGAADLGEAANVLFCEGGPDLLSAWHLIYCEDREIDTVPVAMLGAGQKIHPDAVELFRGKRVRFFPHDEHAGKAAVVSWWRMLDPVAARIDAFDFNGLIQQSGAPVSDLNDFLNTEVDAWEHLHYVRSPMP